MTEYDLVYIQLRDLQAELDQLKEHIRDIQSVIENLAPEAFRYED